MKIGQNHNARGQQNRSSLETAVATSSRILLFFDIRKQRKESHLINSKILVIERLGSCQQ